MYQVERKQMNQIFNYKKEKVKPKKEGRGNKKNTEFGKMDHNPV